MSICGSVSDEWVAQRILAERLRILEPIRTEMRRRLQVVSEWIAGKELLEWVPPQGGVVCFPDCHLGCVARLSSARALGLRA